MVRKIDCKTCSLLFHFSIFLSPKKAAVSLDEISCQKCMPKIGAQVIAIVIIIITSQRDSFKKKKQKEKKKQIADSSRNFTSISDHREVKLTPCSEGSKIIMFSSREKLAAQ